MRATPSWTLPTSIALRLAMPASVSHLWSSPEEAGGGGGLAFLCGRLFPCLPRCFSPDLPDSLFKDVACLGQTTKYLTVKAEVWA